MECTSRNSSRSLASLALVRAAQASSGHLSGILFKSNLRLSLQSMVLWPIDNELAHATST